MSDIQVAVKIDLDPQALKLEPDYEYREYGGFTKLGYIRYMEQGEIYWRETCNRAQFRQRSLGDYIEGQDANQIFERVNFQHPLPAEFEAFPECFSHLRLCGYQNISHFGWDDLPGQVSTKAGKIFERAKSCVPRLAWWHVDTDHVYLRGSAEDVDSELAEFLELVTQKVPVWVRDEPNAVLRALKEFTGGWAIDDYREDHSLLRFDPVKKIRSDIRKSKQKAGQIKRYDPPINADDVSTLYSGFLRMLNGHGYTYGGGYYPRHSGAHSINSALCASSTASSAFGHCQTLIDMIEQRHGHGSYRGCETYKDFFKKVHSNLPDALRKAQSLSESLKDWILQELSLAEGLQALQQGLGMERNYAAKPDELPSQKTDAKPWEAL